jgi:DNA-3-methyladenine glycosylase I
MGECDVERLLADEGIIRHRGKIESTINNANRALEAITELGSLGALVWAYEPERPTSSRQTTTPEAAALANDLKKRGWSFVGPTTMYAFMQAMGIVNDHFPECHYWEGVDSARRSFVRPGSPC